MAKDLPSIGYRKVLEAFQGFRRVCFFVTDCFSPTIVDCISARLQGAGADIYV